MNLQQAREYINDSLHNPCTHRAKIVNGILSFLIIFSIAVIPLHFWNGIDWIHDELFFFDRLTVTIFTVEYILRIWSAKRPWAYVTSWWGVVDLVAILPFYLAQVGLLASPEIFLLLRILRILKFARTQGMELIALRECELHHHGNFELLPKEKVEKVIQKHPIVFLLGMLLPLFFTTAGLSVFIVFQGGTIPSAISILLFLFAFIFFIKAWLDYNYDVIYITNYRVIIQNRELFGSISNNIPYESITNVVPSNLGIFRWIFGIGDVHIQTADNTTDNLFFQNAPAPHHVVRTISTNRQKLLNAREGRELEELDALRKIKQQEEKIGDFIERREEDADKSEKTEES
jgi:hypothetical protein